MASIDHDRKRVSAAVLFYGPPGAGKTTSLYALGRQLPAGTHGKVAPLQQSDGRLLKLDYRPHDQDMVYGYQVSFRLVTCPGQIEVDLIKPLVGAIDAILFVADSSRQAMNSNVKALELLDKMVRSSGKSLDSVPMVFLYNKRDLREAVEIRSLEERLNRYGCSYIAASAVRGQGVLDGLQRLTASVALQVRQQVQASGQGNPEGSVRTVAHGTSYQQARAMHQMGGDGGGDERTSVSSQSDGPDWELEDDRTEVNPKGDSWVPDAAEPSGGTGRWRTPDQFAEDVDADDRTMPFADGVPDDDDVPDPDDVTMAQIGPSAPAGAGPVRTRLQPVGAGARPAPRAAAAPPAPPTPSRPARGARPAPARSLRAEQPPSRTRRVVPAQAPSAPLRPSSPPQRASRGAPQRPAAPPARPAAAPSRPTAPPARPAAPPARPPAPPQAVPPAGGGDPFTSTQVINNMGRMPEAWEGAMSESANRMNIPVPELAGYVISRIGTPRANTRRTVEIPVRATHMDTLMPQDLILHIQFSGGMRSGAPPEPKKPPGNSSVPRWWFVASLVIAVLALAALAGLYSLQLAA